MKKSKTVRILCMVLALLLVSQFAVTAMAATSSTWSDGAFSYYVSTAMVNSNAVREQMAEATTTITHTQWNTTYMDGYYDMTVDEYWNWFFKEFGNDIIHTAAKDGYDYYYEENNLYLQDAVGGIPSSEQSGQYYVLADSKNYKINSTLYRDDGSGYAVYIVDTVYAPYDIYPDATGYRAA